MFWTGIAVGFVIGGFFGVATMCFAAASGKASRAEEKELEKFKQDDKGKPQN